MPTLIAEKTVRARKPHQCRTCHQTAILPGETYRRETYVYDGRVYDWVMCDACTACSRYVFDWCYFTEEGIGADEYDEWAHDTARLATVDADQQTDEQRAAIAYLVRRHGLIVGHYWIGVAGHPDDPECTHREDGTDDTYCGRPDRDHLWDAR